MAQLAGSVSVDLVPGATDPASGILPQQPLHKCMFPQVDKDRQMVYIWPFQYM